MISDLLRRLLRGLFLERLAGLEDGDSGRRNLDGFLRLGVAAHARLALLRLEAAEADARCHTRHVLQGSPGGIHRTCEEFCRKIHLLM